MEKKFVAEFSLGVLFFTGLLALSFSFGPNGIQFLINSIWSWTLFVFMAVSAFLIVIFGRNLHKKSLSAIGLFYLCVPFGFYFSDGIHWILLEHHLNVAIGFWGIGAISIGLFLFRKTDATAN